MSYFYFLSRREKQTIILFSQQWEKWEETRCKCCGKFEKLCLQTPQFPRRLVCGSLQPQRYFLHFPVKVGDQTQPICTWGWKKKMLKLLRTKPPAGIFERAEQQIFHSPVNLRCRFPVWTTGRLTEQRVHSKRAKRTENKKHIKMELKIKGLHDRLYYILDDSQSIRSNPVSQPPQNCTPERRVNHNMISLFPIDTKTKDKDAFLPHWFTCFLFFPCVVYMFWVI